MLIPPTPFKPRRSPRHALPLLAWALLANAALADNAITPRPCQSQPGLGPEMVLLPAGSFTMGSPATEAERSADEGPAHEVTVARPFAIGRCEVTFADYDRFAAATGRAAPDDYGWGRGDRPVVNVNWDDAVAYADWLSAMTGRRYRLPSEAEWEYAARAGTKTAFYTGVCIDTGQANYNGNFDYNACSAGTGVYLGKTQPVGSYPANPWGLYDMAGNAWEWVADCWHDRYDPAPGDATAWAGDANGYCATRVIRGGSWYDKPWRLRSANRFRLTPDYRSNYLGFRLAQDID